MNNKHHGFTLIELMIVIAIIAISAAIALPAIFAAAGSGDTNQKISFGYNGMVETRCLDGYRYTIGSDGSARQIINADGRPASCVE